MNSRENIIPWEFTWMNLAHEMSKRSKDPSTQCGCVVVKNRKYLLGMGYNGPPRDIHDNSIDWSDRNQKYPVVFHSESNALWDANDKYGKQELIGSVLYVTGRPCHRCVLEAVRARAVNIVHDDTENGNQAVMCDEEDWKKVLFICSKSNTMITPLSYYENYFGVKYVK